MTHVGIVARSKPIFGGAFQYTQSMIEALLRIPGNRYTLFTGADNDSYERLGLPIVRLPPTVLAFGRFLANNVRLSNSSGLFHQVDKVIAPLFSTYLLTSCRPFTFTLHDLQEKYYPQHFSVVQRLWRHTTGTLLSRAAGRIICESNYVKNDIARFYHVAQEKIVVIPAPPISA